MRRRHHLARVRLQWTALRARLHLVARPTPRPLRWWLFALPTPAWAVLALPPSVPPVPVAPPAAPLAVAAPPPPPPPLAAPAAPVPPSAPCLGPRGSACAPIPLAGPAVVDGSTRSAPAQAVDVWPCAPAVPEAGGEIWYTLSLDRPARVHAAIVEDPQDGIDVDLHLLSAADPTTCFRRDDSQLEADLAAGAWFLVVDTCSSTGVALPGRYRLTVGVDPR